MKTKLPFSMPCGDMYSEHNIKPTPKQVTEFLDACEKDPQIQATLMWSMDQMTKVPELWKAFAEHKWGTEPPPSSLPLPRNGQIIKRVVLDQGTKLLLIDETPTHYLTQFYIDKPFVE